MTRSSLVSLILAGICCTAAPAMAGGAKAMIKATGSHAWLDSETVPCSIVIEGVLRDRGFEVIERTRPKSDAGLVVFTSAHCTGIWHPSTSRWSRYHRSRPHSACKVHARLQGPKVRNTGVRGSADSNTGHLNALSGACRQVAEKIDRHLGGKGNIDDAEVHSPGGNVSGKQRLTVSFRWKGELKPMPLLIATKFFQQAGYVSKLKKGGKTNCDFTVTIFDDRERFAHLLTTYFEGRYRIKRARSKANRLVFALSPK